MDNFVGATLREKQNTKMRFEFPAQEGKTLAQMFGFIEVRSCGGINLGLLDSLPIFTAKYLLYIPRVSNSLVASPKHHLVQNLRLLHKNANSATSFVCVKIWKGTMVQ